MRMYDLILKKNGNPLSKLEIDFLLMVIQREKYLITRRQLCLWLSTFKR